MNDKGLRTKTAQMKKRQPGCGTANVPKGRVLQEERFVQKKVAGLIRLSGRKRRVRRSRHSLPERKCRIGLGTGWTGVRDRGKSDD